MGTLKNYKIGPFIFLLALLALPYSCRDKKEVQQLSFLLPEGSECVEIINADSLALNSRYLYRELFDKHPTLIVSNYVTVLDDSLSSPIHLPFDYSISDIHWNEGQCFFASDSTIYYGDNRGNAYPILKTNKTIRSFTVTNERILCPLDSLLVEYIFGTDSVSCLINTHRNITKTEDCQSCVFYALESDIFLLYDNVAYHIYQSQNTITSFVVDNEGGLFIGTELGLEYVTPEYTAIEIATLPVSDLTLIGDDLYIVFADNNSVKITKVSNYKALNSIEI